MGNNSCGGCMKNTDNGLSYNSNTIDFQLDSQAELNKTEENKIIAIQANWKASKARTQFKKNKEVSEYDTICPGVEILPDQPIGRVNLSIENTESKLNEFSYKNTTDGKIISLLYEDNSIYIGTFDRNWNRNGNGLFYATNGSKYQGEFSDNKMKGYGRIIYPEGNYYEGDFDDDKPNGFGVYNNNEGVTYEGQFKDEMKNGEGKESREDGSMFVGNYLNDAKHGLGKHIWQDSSAYEGSLCNNVMEGFGKMIYADGRVYLGQWRNSKMDGKGVFVWPDNRVYIGIYENYKKSNYGIFLWSNGKKYEGNWLNGKLHGNGKYSFKGTVQLAEWRFGKKIRLIQDNFQNVNTVDYSTEVNAFVEEINKRNSEFDFVLEKYNLNSFDDPNLYEKIKNYKI